VPLPFARVTPLGGAVPCSLLLLSVNAPHFPAAPLPSSPVFRVRNLLTDAIAHEVTRADVAVLHRTLNFSLPAAKLRSGQGATRACMFRWHACINSCRDACLLASSVICDRVR
jgi:hypothetical protein